MAITGNASYIPTMNEFAAHWGLCNAVLGTTGLIIRLPDNTTMSQTQFVGLRASLLAQQTTVQSKLNDVQIARGNIDLQKGELLTKLNAFNGYLDAYYQNTSFIQARPNSPGIGDGQERFTGPLIDAMTLWEKINAAPAPAGVTLPLTLADGTTQATFASAVAALQFAYQSVKDCGVVVALARQDRNIFQDRAYSAMKVYRQAVPVKLSEHPNLVASMPALTPVTGHTPDTVNVSGVFQPPDESKVVYGASSDPDLQEYQLRGTVGDSYDEEDAIVIATHSPGEPREFVTTFGLTQPGAKVALKVFVVLTTGNESGSATVVVERPAQSVPLAA